MIQLLDAANLLFLRLEKNGKDYSLMGTSSFPKTDCQKMFYVDVKCFKENIIDHNLVDRSVAHFL